MGHYITGLIARREVLGRLGGAFAVQPCFALEEDMAFMPLERENLDEVTGLHTENAMDEFYYLTDRLIELLRSASHAGETAYIETDYHGGYGGQGAAVLRDGEIIGAPEWGEGGAINRALAKLGVTPRPGLDAFDTVGPRCAARERGLPRARSADFEPMTDAPEWA
jgi:hypothetical protein